VLIPLLLAACLDAAPLLRLEEHDYVYPRLSPDGRTLAVAAARVRPGGAETTSVLMVDVASGRTRELVGESLAEANETYETYVSGLRWLDDDRVEVHLSDGDVGGTDLTVDARSGAVLRTQVEDAVDLVPPELAHVARDAKFYAPHFRGDELAMSLGSAAPLTRDRLLVQRRVRGERHAPLFLIDSAKKAIRRVVTVPREYERSAVAESDGEIVFLLTSDSGVRAYSHRAGRTSLLAAWEAPMRGQCSRTERVGGRWLAFVRPCDRSEPASGTLRDLRTGAVLLQDLDEISFSADGTRAAIARWRGGRRMVEIIDCPLRSAALPAPTPRCRG
jgi:hypothetical protein